MGKGRDKRRAAKKLREEKQKRTVLVAKPVLVRIGWKVTEWLQEANKSEGVSSASPETISTSLS
jgi:hypothetical protein